MDVGGSKSEWEPIASNQLNADGEVFGAVKQSWRALEFAWYGLKDNCMVVKMPLEQSSEALMFASNRWRGNQEIGLMVVDCEEFKLVDEGLRGDKDFMLEVLKRNGRALKYASDKLKCDRDVVMEAVKQNGMALKYANMRYASDKEIVLAAVRRNGCALSF